MTVLDKTAGFLSQLGKNIGPALGQIGSTVGTAVAGTPGTRQIAIDPEGVGQVFTTLPTYGLLGRMGLPQVANRVQYEMTNPLIAQAVGAGSLGAGAIATGLAVKTAVNRAKQEKPRMAGQI